MTPHPGIILAVLFLVLATQDSRANSDPPIPSGGTLSLDVTSNSGAPLPGGRIWVWNKEETWTARTNPRGRARLDNLPVGPVHVLAAAERHVGQEHHDVQIFEGKETALQFVLRPGIPFDGTLLDADGGPIPDESILVLPGGTFEGFSELLADQTPFARTRTDSKGRFHVEGIPPGAIATVVVRAEGHEVARVAVKAIADGVLPSLLVIRLMRGASVTGTVLSPDGVPVAGALVSVVPGDEESFLQNPHIRIESSDGRSLAALHGTTDAQGRYSVAGLEPGRAVVICAEAAGFARSAWSRSVSPTPGQAVTGVDLVLRRPAALVVQVGAKQAGPVGEARVQVGDFMSGIRSEEGEAPGTWRFERLRPDRYEIRVSAPGYLEASRKVELAEGQRLELEIELDPGAAIEGVVVDLKGAPVPGAWISAERTAPGGHEGWGGNPSGQTDTLGRFRIGGLLPGRHKLKANQFVLSETAEILAPARGVRLTATPFGIVRMRLVAPEGSRLPAAIALQRRKGAGTSRHEEKIPGGLLVLEGLEGQERIAIVAQGFVRAERSVEARPGEVVELGEIVLDPGVPLEGRVADLAGRPVAGALVSHQDWTQSLTDEEGRFRLPHVPPGPIALQVQASGFLPLEGQVEPKEGRAGTLCLRRGALLQGVLRDPKGKPISQAWLFVEWPGPDGGWEYEEEFMTEKDGTFTVRVTPGRRRIVWEGSRGQDPEVLIVLEAAEGDVHRPELVYSPQKEGPDPGSR